MLVGMPDEPAEKGPDGPDPAAGAEHATFRATAQPLMPAERPEPPERYGLYPASPLRAGRVDVGWQAIAGWLAPVLSAGGTVVIDGVAGVMWDRLRNDVIEALARVDVAADWFDVREAMLDESHLDRTLHPWVTDDVLFGKRHPGVLADLFDGERLAALRREAGAGGPGVLFGPGAALAASDGDDRDAYVVWAEVPRNEEQYRSRAGVITNLGKTQAEDPKSMYKRFYFVDWVLIGRHLERLLPQLDLVIDTQRPDTPTCTTGDALRTSLQQLARTPFRARPWFSPGVWGGHWIEELIPELPRHVPNYAWSFELIVPENGILFEEGGRLLEVPFALLMYQEKARVLGRRHVERFGNEFPIRFDLLDTVEGENLSLQVHPTPDFIREQFGESFTQDETYYILDADPGAEVYLGFRDGVDPESFRRSAQESARASAELDVRHFVQTHPARKHELFLIPHGTIHCSGSGNLVLEISATPYIFTFKIYDWLRLDLDGNPRPLNIERAFDNLDFTMQGPIVPRTLISRPVVIAAGDGFEVVHLPTHEKHFYDVHRLDVATEVEVQTNGSCHVLSLVDGERVILETGSGAWRCYFAETFVVPAAVESYRLRTEDGTPVKIVKAFLK